MPTLDDLRRVQRFLHGRTEKNHPIEKLFGKRVYAASLDVDKAEIDAMLRRLAAGGGDAEPEPWTPKVPPKPVPVVPPLYEIRDGAYLWELPDVFARLDEDPQIAAFHVDEIRANVRPSPERPIVPSEEEVEAHRELRRRLCSAVSRACDELYPSVRAYSPAELYAALYAWCGNAMPLMNGPIEGGDTWAVLCRSFHRLVNLELYRDVERSGAFGKATTLSRANFKFFEHMSRRGRWNDFQLARAREIYVPRVRRRMVEWVELLRCNKESVP